MANPEHLQILKQGVEAWNAWREQNEGIRPDLSPTEVSPADLNCQLDTNIHLWRITAHNSVQRRGVGEMLKAPPYAFRAGAVAPTAPHKPAELGDPGDGLAQRRWLDRRGGDPMDGTIQRLPFVGL